jgi:hypothetical protein
MSIHYKNLDFTISATVAAAALCGLLLFGCSYQALEEGKPSKYDEQGRLLVDFSVPTELYGGGVRALSVEVAQSAWDYAQAVFEFDADGDGFGNEDDIFYAGSAARGEDLHFSLPEGAYRALMFLGTKAGLRLLATGAVTGLKDSAAYVQENILNGLFNITQGVRVIEFTVSSLVSDIDEGALTFSGPVGKNGADGVTTVVDGGIVPYFNVPPAVQAPYSADGAIRGTFKFSGFPDTLTQDGDEFELGSDTPDADAWFDLAGDKASMIQTIGILAYNRKTEAYLAPVPVAGTVQSVKLSNGQLAIDFGLKTSENPELQIGFNKLQFFASVQAFKNGAGLGDKGDVWRIANGFRAGELDLGGASMGQNVLLMVGDSKKMTGLVDVVITGVDVDSVQPYYVKSDGDDSADGSETTPFLTLRKAYEAASNDPKRKTVAVMDDLEATGAVALNINKTLPVTIRGVSATPPILTRSDGSDAVINVTSGAKVKFQNITIDGSANGGTNRALYVIDHGTKVTLAGGATITGRTANDGGAGAYVAFGAWLVLSGGAIVNCSANNGYGGGVYTTGLQTKFTMYSGKISNNTVTNPQQSYGGDGGGVYIDTFATFIMNGGEISGNAAIGDAGSDGGGVGIGTYSAFNMNGGVIGGNTATGYGGGVYINNGEFNMFNGFIYGSDAAYVDAQNTANESGDAVYLFDYYRGNISASSDDTVRFVNGQQF